MTPMLGRRDMIRAMAVTGALASVPVTALNSAFAAGNTAPTLAPDAPWTDEGAVQRSSGLVHWVAMGKGPAVVMMPKLGGWAADWRHVAPLLADRYRVIVIDPPGHGGSRMATPAPYIHTLPESAAMIRAALTELGVERFAFVGNSLGGCIGIAMAALFPEDLTHLVVLSSTLASGVAWKDVPAFDVKQAAPGNFDKDWNPVPRTFEEMNARFGLTPQIHEEMNASRAVAGQWIRASERGVFVADMPSFLPLIRTRTLLIYGSTGSYLKYRATGERLIANVSTAAIGDSGSFVHQQKPQKTARVLADFLST